MKKLSPDYFASASHFFMKEFLAAPANGFPFLLTAFSAQPDGPAALLPPSHFLMEEALAAPVSGLPFLPTAFASQPEVAVVAVGDAASAFTAGAAGFAAAGWAGVTTAGLADVEG
jgi:hypothetical protein